jgi:hypothetical protein
MNSFNWERFLRQWSQDLIESVGNASAPLPQEVIHSVWLGYPGATEEQIIRAEARLQTTLPPSYRAFLKVTNGWRQTTPFIDKLWSVEQIEWFSVRHQDWIDTYAASEDGQDAVPLPAFPLPSVPDEEYFVYGDAQDCSLIRVEYLQTMLEISDRGDSSIYLLNPQVIDSAGEWEAWFFGNWLPGADRYRSFQEMMQAEYENFLELRETNNHSVTHFAPDNSRGNELEHHEQNVWRIETDDNSRKHPVEQATETQPDDNQRSIESHNLELEAPDLRERSDSVDPVAAPATFVSTPLVQPTLPSNELLRSTPIAIRITQIHAIQPLQPGAAIPIAFKGQVQNAIVHSNQPFALAIVLKLIGLSQQELQDKQICCVAQFYARNLQTGAVIHLGDTQPKIPVVGQRCFRAHLAETLLHPGIYCLQVLATLQGAIATPGYLEIPQFQVV